MKPKRIRSTTKRKLAPSNIKYATKTSSAPSRKADISTKNVEKNEGTTKTSMVTRVWSGLPTLTPQTGQRGSSVATNITDLRYGLSEQFITDMIIDPHNITSNQLQPLTYDQNFQHPSTETLQKIQNICGKTLEKQTLHEHDYCITPHLITNKITREHNYAKRNKGISTLSDQISSLGTQRSVKGHAELNESKEETISALKCEEEQTVNVKCSFDDVQLNEDDETVSAKSFGINAEANEDAEETVSIRSFETTQCDFCSIEYINKGDLLLHIQEKHLEIKPEVLQASFYLPANDQDVLNAADSTTEQINENCLEFKTEDVDVHSESLWECDAIGPSPVLDNNLNPNEINHALNENNINEENVTMTRQGFELSEYEKHEEKFKDLLDVERPQNKEFTENFVENESSQTAQESDQLLFALCANCSKFSSEFKKNDNGVIMCQMCQQSMRRSFDLEKHQKHEEKCKDLHDDAYEHEQGDNFVQEVDVNNLLKPLKIVKRNAIEQTMVSCSNCYVAMQRHPKKDNFEEILCHECTVDPKLKRQTCKICNKRLLTSSWYSHLRNVHGKGGHTCKVCQAEFKCAKYLKIHSQRIHESKIKVD